MTPQTPSERHPLQEDFEDFFERSLCGFIITDIKGSIFRANSKVMDWTNSSIEELKGKRFSDLLSIGSKIYYETHLSPLLRMQGFFEEVMLEISYNSGPKLRVMVNALERRDKDGQPLFIRFTVLKAKDRLQYEQNLQEARNIAEKEVIKQTEIVSLREQLIAVLGHDLRNPLAAIKMATDLLTSSPEGDQAHLLGIIKRSNVRMTELVSNIMDFTRTRLGQGIVIERKESFLKPVLQQVIDELRLIYPKREIKAILELDKPVYCDPDRIAQLLSNLIGNALTHGDADSPIRIFADDHSGYLKLTVCNNGIPIPENIKANMFEPFMKEQPSGQNGLGLGLFICSEIARAHGAELSFTSTEKETCFIFNMVSKTV